MRKAIVMAGGQGSRLQPLTLTRPKPMVPVANRPVMAHILEWLRGHGFAEVLVTLYYRADDIRRDHRLRVVWSALMPMSVGQGMFVVLFVVSLVVPLVSPRT